MQAGETMGWTTLKTGPGSDAQARKGQLKTNQNGVEQSQIYQHCRNDQQG